MSYLTKWNNLIGNQTDESFSVFWEKYSDAEKQIYGSILKDKKTKLAGTFTELIEEYDVDPVLFMGFLDGINTSLIDEIDLEVVEDETKLTLEIDLEKLYFNMHKAEAKHLYTLPEWDAILTDERRDEIANEYKKSKTIVKEKTPGRNDLCPCGSGKKYKKCCGKVS